MVGAGIGSQESEPRLRAGVRGKVPEPGGCAKVRGQELGPTVSTGLPGVR